MPRKPTNTALLTLTLAMLCSCGGGGSSVNAGAGAESVRTTTQSVRLNEDTIFTGTVSFAVPSGPVTFRLDSPPTHGTVTLNEATGVFSYTPLANYFGTDSFVVATTDATGANVLETVALRIDGVDDPPEIAALPDAGNSPYEYEVTLPLSIRDVDSEALGVTATAQDYSVVEALVDPAGKNLILRPKRLGTSRVDVRVSDGSTTVSRELTFVVKDVTRPMQVSTSTPSSQAIVLTNTSNSAVDFELTHNGHLAFTSMDQILDAVRAQPDEVVNEPMERKIWRFIRDNTYHASPVNTQLWMNAPWPLLNSFGWGFCSHVTSAFVRIAEAAGYEARSWELSGHVVPEIRIDGRWQMYDPDVAIYYYRHDGTHASVADVSADTSLITAPVNPIFSPGENDPAYGQLLATIYGSTDDNYVTEYASPDPFYGSRITLPSGGRLIYPGRWTEAPTGYDGPTPSTIEQFRQARLELPAGFSGPITTPWVPWDVQGTGVVRINGRDFDAGSQELQNFLAQPGGAVTEIGIIENPSGLAIVTLINPLWYDMQGHNDLLLTGKDVWAIQGSSYSLPTINRPPPPVPAWLRKPRPP